MKNAKKNNANLSTATFPQQFSKTREFLSSGPWSPLELPMSAIPIGTFENILYRKS